MQTDLRSIHVRLVRELEKKFSGKVSEFAIHLVRIISFEEQCDLVISISHGSKLE